MGKLTCPDCGSTAIGIGRQEAQARMTPIGSVFTASKIIAYICTDCGLIVKTKVEKPKIFKKSIPK